MLQVFKSELLGTYQQLIRNAGGTDDLAGYVSFESAEKHLGTLQPDVILLDVELQGISGIILTVFESEKEIFEALGNGAAGYLTKDCPVEK